MVILFYFGEIKRTTFQQLASSTPRLECRSYYLNSGLSAGYSAPAAIIAGVVLETSLRELCSRENIAHGKMDKMNADLTKSGVYNSIVQKKITSFAGIRNSAAHGKPSEFSKADVEQMIVGIEDFLTTNLNT